MEWKDNMSSIKSALIAIASNVGVLHLAMTQKRMPPLILMYHGVTRHGPSEELRNFEGKHLVIDLFVKHLHILRRSRRVIPLQEMIDGLYAGDDLTNSVSITFDDGYENNVSEAAPILSDFNVPATFFLATGLIGKENFIWTDRIEMALDRTWKTEVNLLGNIGNISIRSIEEKRHALVTIKQMFKMRAMECLDQAVQDLADRLDVPDVCADGDYRFMNWDQARTLVRSGFDVGAHTVTHPVLTRIPFNAAIKEIVESRNDVINETGQCSSAFCFPNGKFNDYNPELQAYCRTHFKAALSTNRGMAIFDDIYELKRLSPAGKNKGENIEWTLLMGR